MLGFKNIMIFFSCPVCNGAHASSVMVLVPPKSFFIKTVKPQCVARHGVKLS